MNLSRLGHVILVAPQTCQGKRLNEWSRSSINMQIAKLLHLTARWYEELPSVSGLDGFLPPDSYRDPVDEKAFSYQGIIV